MVLIVKANQAAQVEEEIGGLQDKEVPVFNLLNQAIQEHTDLEIQEVPVQITRQTHTAAVVAVVPELQEEMEVHLQLKVVMAALVKLIQFQMAQLQFIMLAVAEAEHINLVQAVQAAKVAEVMVLMVVHRLILNQEQQIVVAVAEAAKTAAKAAKAVKVL